MDLSHLSALGVSVSGEGEIYPYESTEHLMNATVQQISKIMDLPGASLTNTNPPKPDYPGAVQVARYREEHRQNHSESDQTNMPSVQNNEPLKDVDVKLRAAWAWARSAKLYNQCARNLEQKGPQTEALNLKTAKDKCAIHEKAVQTLRKRARMATSHAEKLLSETTADDFWQWTRSGEGLSNEDVEYYVKHARYYEHIQRAKMANVYQSAARGFVLEALYTFVDCVIEHESPTKDMTSNQYVRNLWHKEDIAAALEAVLSLWARACRWSVQVGGGNIPLSGDCRQRRFREMVRRAVHHRAHAEWLVQEPNELRQDVSSTRKRIEPWRLAYPSGVDLYINDCVIRTHVGVSDPEVDPYIYWTAPEDDYLEWYVCVLVQHSDFRRDVSTGYGAPGAPDMIYDKLATRTFPETPASSEFVELPADFLSGLVSTSSTRLEVYTAIIGDKIFEEWCAASLAETALRKSGASLGKVISLIRRDVETVINRDCYAKETPDSPETVCNVIQNHLDSLRSDFLRQSNFNTTLLWMYTLEQELRLLVRPWYDLRLYRSYVYDHSRGQMTLQLLCPKTCRVVGGKPCAVSMLDLLRLEHVQLLQQYFHEERRRIIGGTSPLASQDKANSHIKKWMLRYRGLLERWNWGTVPVLTTWSLQPFQLEPEAAVYNSILDTIHANPHGYDGCERDLKDLCADQRKAIQEQNKAQSESNPSIRRLFDQLDEQGWGSALSADPELEAFSKVRNSKKPKPDFPGFGDPPELEAGARLYLTLLPSLEERDGVESKLLANAYSDDPALIRAANFGDEKKVKQLLEKGEETEVINNLGITPLLMATLRGHESIVRLLLQNGADLGAKIIEFGYTSLHIAVLKNYESIVKLLLDRGADVEENTLSLAVESGNETILQHLLSYGADIAARYSGEKTALHQAAARGAERITQQLIINGADLEAKDINGMTPMHVAAKGGQGAIVQLLLNAGANIEAKDNRGCTALHISTRTQNTEVMEILLDNKANIEANVLGLTPLHMTAVNGWESAMRLLLSKGANANAAHPEGGATALHMEVFQDHNPSILHLLLEYGAHVDARGTEPQGETPFHIAAQWGKTMAARILLHWGADVNATYHNGQTALHRAAAAGQWKMVLLLLSEGADITAETKGKDTAFSVAASFDRERVVKILLDKGASLMSNNQKATGFIMAAGSGRKSVVATLIDRGIAVDAMDEYGTTALNIAAWQGHEPVVALLLEKGANVNATALQLADMNNHRTVVRLLQQAGGAC